MTSGTVDLMEKIVLRHQELTIYLMNSSHNTLVYYENENKSIFNGGRSYEVIVHNGSLVEDEGFVVMNHIPLSEEGIPVFEYRFKKHQYDLENVPGFVAFRLLKPTKGNTYVVLTQWAEEEDYDAWKESDNFSKAHENQAVKPPAYFTERPFTSTYKLGDEEEEEEIIEEEENEELIDEEENNEQ